MTIDSKVIHHHREMLNLAAILESNNLGIFKYLRWSNLNTFTPIVIRIHQNRPLDANITILCPFVQKIHDMARKLKKFDGHLGF